jgi:hypothetical protein
MTPRLLAPHGPNVMSRSASERGRLGVGIGGDSLADEPEEHGNLRFGLMQPVHTYG